MTKVIDQYLGVLRGQMGPQVLKLEMGNLTLLRCPIRHRSHLNRKFLPVEISLD